MKNMLVISMLLTGSVAFAMEPVVPAVQAAPEVVEAIAKDAKRAAEAVADAAVAVAQKAQDCVSHATCKDHNHGIMHSVQGLFKDGVTFANAQLAQVSKTTSTLKLNGWNALNKNEKIGVAVAGTAIVATTAYLICKLYNAVTKTDKNSKVCVSVKQVRS